LVRSINDKIEDLDAQIETSVADMSSKYGERSRSVPRRRHLDGGRSVLKNLRAVDGHPEYYPKN